MNFHVITLFPEVIDAYAGASILGRAQKDKKITIKSYHLRDFVTNKWGKADERPYGGGPGMVLQAEPFVRAVEKLRKKNPKAKVLITAAGGVPLTHAYAKKLTKQKTSSSSAAATRIDARVKKILKAEEVSVGPYILTGGELPALTIIDTAARQIPGVLGKFESLEEGGLPVTRSTRDQRFLSTKERNTGCQRCYFRATMPRWTPGRRGVEVSQNRFTHS